MNANHLNISLAEATFEQIYEEIKLRTDHSIVAVMYNNSDDWELFADGRHIELCGLVEVINRRKSQMLDELMDALENDDNETDDENGESE